MAFVDQHCRQARSDGYIRSLSADLSVRDTDHDLYDHACFLLADAWRFRAFGDAEAIDSAVGTMRLLDDRFTHPAGGWLEGDYAHDYRRQNPHMHLFEAFLALSEATDDDFWLARADEVYALFVEHFFEPNVGVVLEYFDDGLAPAPGEAGDTVEPGHMLEWVWLLRCYERQSGTVTGKYADPLFGNSLEIGRSESGLLFDAIGTDGSVRVPMKRLWAMPELIKAGLVQARAGHPDGEQVAARAIADFFANYVDKSPDVPYCDRLDADDKVLDEPAAASSMYHLTSAAIEIVDYLES